MAALRMGKYLAQRYKIVIAGRPGFVYVIPEREMSA